MRLRHSASRLLGLLLIGATVAASGCSGTSSRERFLVRYVNEVAPQLSADEAGRIASAIVRAERESGVDALLLAAVIEQESHFRSKVRSRRGAVGLMQLRPATARAVAEKLGRPDDAARLEDPTANVGLGAAYLAQLHEQLGEWSLALAAYHQGPSRVRAILARGRRPSMRYSNRVLERYETLTRSYREG